jgi:hypothetical protein
VVQQAEEDTAGDAAGQHPVAVLTEPEAEHHQCRGDADRLLLVTDDATERRVLGVVDDRGGDEVVVHRTSPPQRGADAEEETDTTEDDADADADQRADRRRVEPVVHQEADDQTADDPADQEPAETDEVAAA